MNLQSFFQGKNEYFFIQNFEAILDKLNKIFSIFLECLNYKFFCTIQWI